MILWKRRFFIYKVPVKLQLKKTLRPIVFSSAGCFRSSCLKMVRAFCTWHSLWWGKIPLVCVYQQPKHLSLEYHEFKKSYSMVRRSMFVMPLLIHKCTVGPSSSMTPLTERGTGATELFIPELMECDIYESWFHQDGAAAH